MTSENALTDLVFFRRYPARAGRPLARSEPRFAALSREWLRIRDGLVHPALRVKSPGAPDVVRVRGIVVARRIAPQVGALLTAAEKDGMRLSGGGFRTRAEQIALRRKYCGSTHYDIFERPPSECTP
jgi:hypothetical protein